MPMSVVPSVRFPLGVALVYLGTAGTFACLGARLQALSQYFLTGHDAFQGVILGEQTVCSQYAPTICGSLL